MEDVEGANFFSFQWFRLSRRLLGNDRVKKNRAFFLGGVVYMCLFVVFFNHFSEAIWFFDMQINGGKARNFFFLFFSSFQWKYWWMILYMLPPWWQHVLERVFFSRTCSVWAAVPALYLNAISSTHTLLDVFILWCYGHVGTKEGGKKGCKILKSSLRWSYPATYLHCDMMELCDSIATWDMFSSKLGKYDYFHRLFRAPSIERSQKYHGRWEMGASDMRRSGKLDKKRRVWLAGAGSPWIVGPELVENSCARNHFFVLLGHSFIHEAYLGGT